uniref:Uncharacterized protein n=1 Tax=Oryza glumipatula TaxID=40148 RepID=A0A0E0AC33_9ORYZ
MCSGAASGGRFSGSSPCPAPWKGSHRSGGILESTRGRRQSPPPAPVGLSHVADLLHLRFLHWCPSHR